MATIQDVYALRGRQLDAFHAPWHHHPEYVDLRVVDIQTHSYRNQIFARTILHQANHQRRRRKD